MTYYGDHMAGDPGLFSFVKKIKLGRIVGGIARAAFPGAAGIYSAVQQVRAGQSSSKLPFDTVKGPSKSGTIIQQPVSVSRVVAARAKKTGARIVRGKAVSPFAQRMAKARLAAARARARQA